MLVTGSWYVIPLTSVDRPSSAQAWPFFQTWCRNANRFSFLPWTWAGYHCHLIKRLFNIFQHVFSIFGLSWPRCSRFRFSYVLVLRLEPGRRGSSQLKLKPLAINPWPPIKNKELKKSGGPGYPIFEHTQIPWCLFLYPKYIQVPCYTMLYPH